MGAPLSFEMTTAQKAMRLFAVLVEGCERPGPDGAEAIFRGEVRLHAMMFWLRNPDYLAWELLDAYEVTRDRPLLALAHGMLVDDEPILRRDAMLKWRFGAYEAMDDEMAILSSYGLVRTIMKPAGPKSAGNDFLLLPGASALAATLADNVAYRWYGERMRIVVRVAGSKGGGALKERQYKHLEYGATRSQDPIPPILPRVVARLAAFSGGA